MRTVDDFLHPERGFKTDDYLELSKEEMLQLDYDGKVRLLEAIAYELLDSRLEFAKVKSKAAELAANIQIYKEVKSALQSAIRAEYG